MASVPNPFARGLYLTHTRKHECCLFATLPVLFSAAITGMVLYWSVEDRIENTKPEPINVSEWGGMAAVLSGLSIFLAYFACLGHRFAD